MSNEPKIEVRDLRQRNWLWTSKALLFHERIDPAMYKVYGGLAAHADNRTQEAFPSIDTLAERLHMGRNTVIRALKDLEARGAISVEREKGTNNVYSLLDFPPADKPAAARCGKPETSIEWLREVPDGDVAELAKKFFVTERFVRKRIEDVVDYCEAKGKRYSNYKAAVRNFIKGHLLKRPQDAQAERDEVRRQQDSERTRKYVEGDKEGNTKAREGIRELSGNLKMPFK